MIGQNLDGFKLCLRWDAWENICRLNGWNPDPSTKDGAQSNFAHALGISRQYVSDFLKTKKSLSADTMMRIVKYLNMEHRDWSHLFYFKYEPEHASQESQYYNQAKFMGQIPYAFGSPSAEVRKLDNPNVESKPWMNDQA